MAHAGERVSRAVTATFVFTDLVDSTATAARLGPDAAEEMRQTHFRLLQGAVTASGGTEVKNLGGKRYEDWALDDPAGQGVEAVRPIRDEIRRRVEALLDSLPIER